MTKAAARCRGNERNTEEREIGWKIPPHRLINFEATSARRRLRLLRNVVRPCSILAATSAPAASWPDGAEIIMRTPAAPAFSFFSGASFRATNKNWPGPFRRSSQRDCNRRKRWRPTCCAYKAKTAYMGGSLHIPQKIPRSLQAPRDIRLTSVLTWPLDVRATRACDASAPQASPPESFAQQTEVAGFLRRRYRFGAAPEGSAHAVRLRFRNRQRRRPPGPHGRREESPPRCPVTTMVG